MESVAAFAWNGWQASSGISGNLGLEYAYWAALRNYDTFGGKRWAKYLKQVVRLIDEEIAPHFDAVFVNKQRERAKHQPHPFWRDLSMARMAI
nr:hypothetical protein [uncultured Halomonas sp.]